MIKDILKTLKINHYIKNVLVIIPLIFSMNYGNISAWINCIIIFAAFCMISSAVYILNDLIDIENDRNHPIKCNRPIASGRISFPAAVLMLIILSALSLPVSLSLNLDCCFVIISYFILNIFYSLYLKNMPLIDASCIAFGFILRIMAGCYAIDVIFSPLVILLTFFTSMFFTFSKRKLELQLSNNQECCRASLKLFDINLLNSFILVNAILSISFYITYVLDKTTIERAGTNLLYWTVIPFTLIIFRLLFLVNTEKIEDDPIHYIERDLTLKMLSLFFVIIFIIVLNI